MRRFQIVRWLILLFLLVVLGFSSYFTYKAKTADVQNIKSSLQTKTMILDRNNKEAGTLYSQKGTYVDLDQIATSVQNAVISTEDRSFYTNPGFDIKGIARSVIGLVIHHGQITGGGSTLTQQLAKNTLLTQKQSFLRKAQEIFLAVQINKEYSKKDILAMYLNNAYFGNGVWGVQDAARRYFGCDASQLTDSEGATLAAMLRSPSFYNPIDHMDNAISRRNLVLQLEVEAGHMTQAEATAAKATSLTLRNTYTADNADKYPSYFDAVIDEAVKDGVPENDVLNKGYRIYTTLDQTYQQRMDNTFTQSWLFPANASDGTQAQAASIAVDPKTGGVLAVVGNRGKHVYRGLNYATQLSGRSPGSTLKPLMVYTPALENGYHYDSELSDQKQSFGKNKYSPTNPTGVYQDQVPMYTALADSLNVPAVWLLNKIGVQKGVNSLARFGIDLKKSDQNLSAALGGVSTSITPLMLARAYSSFANGGQLPQTHFIRKIVDATGTVVYQDNASSKSVMTKSVANEMTSMMIGTFKHGTAIAGNPTGFTVAGKTGSSEVPKAWGYGTKDQWLVGYTPDIVVATWTGFEYTDKQHFLPGTSEDGVAKIFKSEMENILPATPQTAFGTKDAQEMATEQGTAGTDSTNASDVWSNIQDGFNSARDTLNSWVGGIKNIFK
ncbi:PBP1A family penicillin-binding protein [Lacticaseibacillus zhaodongensis]|uniref:PBP1A family penicillin-binding protein n=1 Tax=Lacticaseibacillus zhaodongensis TaxID=2668065 RepID=UPI0012D35509|nr:PBP1A family penicillin-binding protein [Lacticaseibacillus zhaodongensis]